MRSVVLALSVALGALTAVIVFLLALSGPTANVPLELAKTLLSLAVAIIVTGFISMSLNRYSQREIFENEKATVQFSALRDLKGAYEDASVARFFLSADPSAAMFERQLQALMAARARLQKVQRERFVLGSDVDHLVQEMLDYLRRIGEEYRDNYAEIRRLRLREDLELAKLRESRGDDYCPVSLIELPGFSALDAFVDDEKWRTGSFQSGYEKAKLLLQSAVKGVA